MNDPFATRMPSLAGPARDILPVVPDDTSDLPAVAVALYVEQGGAVRITTATGAQRTLNVADWSILPVGVRRVWATGTTAGGIGAMVVA
ncbi:spike base protein, RCAP_Rcc01079 family [Roseovarius autotrophicus]|uniref:spike base protein, RCAP_Rcc01079 family n=1 Tax=Roseovarius autotrophicus TaxID=2824121 RepID=UPI0019ECBB18|nr:hypothetical protein [Roseovarius autotrophicus]MBE0454306.1 hypothetical protein [Roseovarius sp.]